MGPNNEFVVCPCSRFRTFDIEADPQKAFGQLVLDGVRLFRRREGGGEGKGGERRGRVEEGGGGRRGWKEGGEEVRVSPARIAVACEQLREAYWSLLLHNTS